MKAAIIEKYGDTSEIKIVDMDIPAISPHQVLIKMKAASINPVDWKIMKGDMKPLVKFTFPMRLGSDGAGAIEKVGADVSSFNIGDEVYFRTDVSEMGTFAEYCAIDEKLLSKKPNNMNYNQAATVPLVGLTSYQALLDLAKVKSGDKVLIHAGSGGIGTFAIQFAKHCGAYVATTANPKRFDLLRELGADKLIDYKNEKFEEELEGYDVVFDTLGSDYHEKSYKVLAKDGLLISILGIPSVLALKDFKVSWLIKLVSRVSHHFKNSQAKKHNARYMNHFMHASGSQLSSIKDIIEQDKIKAIIDSTFSLEDIKQALDKSVSGHSVGKIVVEINN